MPVIRDQPNVEAFPPSRKEELLKQLTAELEEDAPANGPVVFEIPVSQSDKIDVMVIWQEWKDIRSEHRSGLIRDAYGHQANRLSLALGLTLEEAIDEGVLPFRVRQRFEEQPTFPEEQVRAAKLYAGGSVAPDGQLVLRFPTQATAQSACQRLVEKLPGTKWVVNHAMD